MQEGGADLAPRDRLAMSGGTLVVAAGGGGLLGVQWEEAGEAARPPTQHRMALTTKTSCPTVSEVLMFLKDKGCP